MDDARAADLAELLFDDRARIVVIGDDKSALLPPPPIPVGVAACRSGPTVAQFEAIRYVAPEKGGAWILTGFRQSSTQIRMDVVDASVPLDNPVTTTALTSLDLRAPLTRPTIEEGTMNATLGSDKWEFRSTNSPDLTPFPFYLAPGSALLLVNTSNNSDLDFYIKVQEVPG